MNKKAEIFCESNRAQLSADYEFVIAVDFVFREFIDMNSFAPQTAAAITHPAVLTAAALAKDVGNAIAAAPAAARTIASAVAILAPAITADMSNLNILPPRIAAAITHPTVMTAAAFANDVGNAIAAAPAAARAVAAAAMILGPAVKSAMNALTVSKLSFCFQLDEMLQSVKAHRIEFSGSDQLVGYPEPEEWL